MKVLFTGRTVNTSYSSTPFEQAIKFFERHKEVAVDTETNVVNSIIDRELYVIAISTKETVWVIDYPYLTSDQIYILIELIKKPLLIAHNMSFDLAILKKYKYKSEKVYCTMIAEQIIENGFDSTAKNLGLAALLYKYFGMEISKDEQTSFTGEPLNNKQIIYAAKDPAYLLKLRDIQMEKARRQDKKLRAFNVFTKNNKGVVKALWWNMEFLKCVVDMEMFGAHFDVDESQGIINKFQDIYEDKKGKALNVLEEEFMPYLKEHGFYDEEGRFPNSIWSSSTKKLTVLNYFLKISGEDLPPVQSSTKLSIKTYLVNNNINHPIKLKATSSDAVYRSNKWYAQEEDNMFFKLLWVMASFNHKKTGVELYKSIEDNIVSEHPECAKALGYVHPRENTFNLGSRTHMLAILQMIDQKILNTQKETLESNAAKHRLIPVLLELNQATYYKNNFGEGFFREQMDPDGIHRTRFNTVLKTGRLSSTKPNLLNIPRTFEQFRKALTPRVEGGSMIGADYDGQELVIVAYLAKEKNWLNYLKNGWDLHSKNAELIFDKEWVNSTMPGCTYYKAGEDGKPMYQKCSCPGHKRMRDHSKSVSFGSIYGISSIGLSLNLNISKEEAGTILDRFFEVCPGIRKMMDKFGDFAIENTMIVEPVFGLVRNFDAWKVNGDTESIRRAGFNTPIQASGSAILKIAFVLMRRAKAHNMSTWGQFFNLVLPYHDETIAEASPTSEENLEIMKKVVEDSMMISAKLGGFDIGAGAESGPSWAEIH